MTELLTEQDILFEAFWKAGLRKLNKKGARLVFDKLLKNKDRNQKIDFVQMLIRDIQQRAENRQFGFDRLHPKTYLNGERWEDDLVIEPLKTRDMTIADELSDNSWWAS